MTHLNPQQLFTPPMYQGTDRAWSSNFINVCNKESVLEWDFSSVMSILANGYALGDRTLFKQIKRQPWLSSLDDKGDVKLLDIPKHGVIWKNPKEAAADLFELLCEEIQGVANGYETIYVLLSGGLDSRIVAGIAHHLKACGKIKSEIIALTWGLVDSRDVQYAKTLADMYKFRWQHVPLDQGDLENNIEIMANILGAATSPIHLHRMDWFKDNAVANSLVLAGSYGDSVGRSEFSKRTVLELLPIKIFNYFDLLDMREARIATQELQAEIAAMHLRTGDKPDYVKYEHEQQAFYMRGLIAHTMSVINYSGTSTVYQVFTSPKVYGYMWSLHPAARTDNVYLEVLELLGSDIASIPWARNNKSMKGNSKLARKELRPNYHDYRTWSINILRKELEQHGSNEFFGVFEQMGFFNQAKLREFIDCFINSDNAKLSHGSQAYGNLVWLLSLQRLNNKISTQLRRQDLSQVTIPDVKVKLDSRSSVRRYLSSIPFIRKSAGFLRREYLRRESLKKYPPDYRND